MYIFKVPLSSSLRFKLKLHFEECHSTFLLTFWIPSVIPPMTGNWNAVKIGNNSNFVAGGFLDTCWVFELSSTKSEHCQAANCDTNSIVYSLSVMFLCSYFKMTMTPRPFPEMSTNSIDAYLKDMWERSKTGLSLSRNVFSLFEFSVL